RQIFEAEDFGDEFTPEAREQEAHARAQAAEALADPAASAERRLQVIVLHKTVPSAEDQIPNEKGITAMGKYMDDLAREGLLVAAEGLHPSRKGARVVFSGPRRT